MRAPSPQFPRSSPFGAATIPMYNTCRRAESQSCLSDCTTRPPKRRKLFHAAIQSAPPPPSARSACIAGASRHLYCWRLARPIHKRNPVPRRRRRPGRPRRARPDHGPGPRLDQPLLGTGAGRRRVRRLVSNRRRRLATRPVKPDHANCLRLHRLFRRDDTLLPRPRDRRREQSQSMVPARAGNCARPADCDAYADAYPNTNTRRTVRANPYRDRLGRLHGRAHLDRSCRRGPIRAVGMGKRQRLAAAGRRQPDRRIPHAQQPQRRRDLLLLSARRGRQRQDQRLVGTEVRNRFRLVPGAGRADPPRGRKRTRYNRPQLEHRRRRSPIRAVDMGKCQRLAAAGRWQSHRRGLQAQHP